ncbi:MAG TPA: tetratricopeptide repeat protein [Terriglobales bacterium]
MRRNNSMRSVLTVMVVVCAATWSACNKTSDSGKSSAEAAGGKIPITTKSEEARKEFLQGRDLSEKLLAQDSLQHLDKAIALDPDFALAEWARANNSPTAKEFFDHLKKAVSLADKASEGERLLILANQAGANAEAAKQKDYLEKLVAAYPNDERAHFNLGGYHFGQLEYAQAIEHYKRATELAPSYSPAYNILGYAYRQAGDYANAEQAFKKYVELIPNDPNPYDSYAELLLKMGRFDDSITQYRKALAIDSNFVLSHFGIAGDLLYSGKAAEAAAELQKITDKARNDFERRTALLGLTVLDVDGGKLPSALKQVDRQYALGEKTNDVAAMAGDLVNKANILVEMQKYDDATKEFERSVQLIEGSSLSQEIKDNAKLLHHYNLAAVAIGKKDLAGATSHADEFRQGAEASKNPAQVRQAHELAGMIALAEKNYDKAIAELQQASNQNPRNLYRLCQAYQGKGDAAKAQDFCTQAAKFNSLPQLNYAFIRMKAQKMAGGKKG